MLDRRISFKTEREKENALSVVLKIRREMVRLCAICGYFSRPHRKTKAAGRIAMVLFVGMASIFLILCLFSSSSLHPIWQKRPWPKDLKVCHNNVTHDTFVRVNSSKMLLVNAYFEHRTLNASIRVIAIAWRSEKISFRCIFCCDDKLVSSPAKLTVHGSHFWFRYGTADLLCEIPQGCGTEHVAVTTVTGSMDNLSFLQVHNQYRRESDFPVDFTICHSTMFKKYNNVLQFVQAMEMYQILGAKRVVLYKTDCSQEMDKAIQYYTGIGLLEIVPWPIDKYVKVSSSWIASLSPGDLHYYGQIPALNDCIYRNMYRTKYLFMNDPDEIILPLRNVTWYEFLGSLEAKYGSDVTFYFENNVFPIEELEESGKYNLSEWAGIPGVNFLRHVLREPIPKSHFTTGKMIVNPRRVFEINVHRVEKQSHRTVEVSYDFGRLYHMRRRKNTKLKKNDLVMDKALWRYAPEMIKERF
ncbi:hypothetical protein AGOR_G00122970 [Albula goreensis]|uniref:Glycosyltransferase family 92 protein n=1 Tax=Albula goreensis TaxID=1534307 RepID=A0A8T3DC85_9TELE|nr:hypothetical protein AGOR_G00122970 [Albula goreensis]